MAMKWVAQMPHPVAAPAKPTQKTRARPLVAQARCSRLIAVTLARKQMSPARTTRRKSCSPPRHDRIRYMLSLVSARWNKRPVQACPDLCAGGAKNEQKNVVKGPSPRPPDYSQRRHLKNR